MLAAATTIAATAFRWLNTTIGTYPQETLFVLLVVSALLFAEKWFRWKDAAKRSLVKASALEKKAEALGQQLTETERRCSELEAENASSRAIKDSLTPHKRRIVTCILCAGEISKGNITREVGLDDSVVTEAINALRYDHPAYVRRCGITVGSHQELFTLTDAGKQYAVNHGIPAIEQGDRAIQQTAADAEREALKEQNAMLFKQHNTDAAKIEALEAKVSELRKLVPPPEMHPLGWKSPFESARPRNKSAATPLSGTSATGPFMEIPPQLAAPEGKPIPKRDWDT